MSIRTKVLVAVALAVLLMALAVWISSRWLLLDTFGKLECVESERLATQIAADLKAKSANLAANLTDLSKWDISYAYCGGGSDEFIERTLVPTTLRDFKIDFYAFLDVDGHLLRSQSLDRATDQIVNTSSALLAFVTQPGLLTRQVREPASRDGVVVIAGRPLLIASQPSYDSDAKGPVHGSIIYARWLVQDELAQLGEPHHALVELIPPSPATPVGSTEKPSAMQASSSPFSLPASTPVNSTIKGDHIETRLPIHDLVGGLDLTLRIMSERNIWHRGQVILWWMVVLVVGTALLVGMGTMLALDRLVLTRIAALSADVNRLGRMTSASASAVLTAQHVRVGTQRDEVAALALAINDMSDRLTALRADLAATAIKAQAAANAKAEFLATMSHEIRTPLNGMIGYAELLHDAQVDPQQREFIDTMRACGVILLALLNDILDFSKLEAGEVGLESIPFDLGEVAEETVAMFAQAAQGKDVELLLDLSQAKNGWVLGDPTRVRQVLTNLIANAVKFTERGEVVVHVHTQTTDDAIAITICVRDTGIGIDSATQATLFTPFTQADSSMTRRFGGTGLGLAITRNLVELMHGRVVPTSTPGVGSDFTVQLSLPKGIPAGSRPSEDTCNLRIVVAAGHSELRRILLAMVTDLGATATLIDDLASLDADAAHVDEAPLLLLVDHAYLAMTDLLQVAARRQVPVILLVPVDAARLSYTGISGVISKPVRRRTLAAALRAAVGKAPERQSTPATLVSLQAEQAVDVSTAGVRVLLVEDNAVNQRVAQALLARLGCRTRVVGNGTEALIAYAQETYDVVLMDCQMPDLDGLATTVELRRRFGRHTPVIALTAVVTDDVRGLCAAAGMDDHLSKPVRPAELQTMIERWTCYRSTPTEPFFALGSAS